MIIASLLSSIPFIYLSKDLRNKLQIFCNNDGKNFTICIERVINTSNWLNHISSENYRIYRNITEEIYKKNKISVDKIPEWELIDNNLISLITQVTLLLVFLFFYNNILNQSREVDMLNITPSDYTLMVSEFKDRPYYKTEEEFKTFLETVKNNILF